MLVSRSEILVYLGILGVLGGVTKDYKILGLITVSFNGGIQ